MSDGLFRFDLDETDDSGEQQFLSGKGYAGEGLSEVLRGGSFGVASHAPKGSKGIGGALGGHRDRIVMLALEHAASRPRDIPAGGSVLYDDKGNVIRAYGAQGIHSKAVQGDNKVEAAAGHVKVKPGGGKKVYLGGDPADGGTFVRVMTEGGASEHVFVRVG